MFVGESTVFKRVTEQLIPLPGFQGSYTSPPAKWLTNIGKSSLGEQEENTA